MPDTSLTLTDRQSRIRDLAVKAKEAAAAAKEKTQEAVDLAVECGNLIRQEKEEFAKRRVGTWRVHFDAHFADVLPIRVAEKFLDLSLTLNDRSIPSSVVAVNLFRSGASALGVLPPKAYAPSAADVKVSTRLTHLRAVNVFVAWQRDFLARTNGKPPRKEVEKLLADLQPVADFLAWLGSTLNPCPPDLPPRKESIPAQALRRL